MNEYGAKPQPQLQIISGRAYPGLANKIAVHMGSKLSEVDLGEFANDEIGCRINESVRGNDVFVIQTHHGDIHKAIMEQLIIIDAAKRASALSITAICPYLGYSRQDRKSKGREPIGARLIVDMLTAAGADRIMSVDLHSGQIQGFFNGPFDHLIAMPIIRKYIQLNIKKEYVIVAPDAGRVKLSERYASALGSDLAIIHKHRSVTRKNTVEAKQLIGDVKGKACILIDDMIDTAGTICAAADLLTDSGATEVYGFATHGIFSGQALERISKSSFKKVIVTDTVPPPEKNAEKIEVVSIAPLIAEAIAAVVAGESVSAIFEGLNQT